MPNSRFQKFKVQEVHTGSPGTSQLKEIEYGNDEMSGIKSYEADSLKSREVSYESNKQKYGPLASTDSEKDDRSQKNRRFSINPLIREPLLIEKEESRAIEEKVQKKITLLTDDAQKKGYDSGYQEGIKKGFDAAFSKFMEDARPNLERFERVVQDAEGARKDIFKANEHFLMDTIFRIARAITLKELSSDREYVVRLARSLVERIGIKDQLILRINAEDAHMIELIKGNLESAYGSLHQIKIEPSSQVPRGACQVETDWNVIDASLETQFNQVYEALVNEEVPAS
jgi:flagellar assembly protein FliH